MEFLQIAAGVFVGHVAATLTLAMYVKSRSKRARNKQMAALEKWAAQAADEQAVMGDVNDTALD